MAISASWVLATLAVLLTVPSAVFAIEVVASLFFRRRQASPASEPRSRVAVLVPAHNEAAGIAETLDNIMAQLGPRDRLLVVADNCSDDTANIATARGAEISVRSDTKRIGKGYALDWGLHH